MCQLSRKASFDLAEERFPTVWDERFGALRARTWQTDASAAPAACSRCAGAVRAPPSWSTGDIEAQVAALLRDRAPARARAAGRRERPPRGRHLLPRQGSAHRAARAATGCGGCGHSEPEGPAAAPADRAPSPFRLSARPVPVLRIRIAGRTLAVRSPVRLGLARPYDAFRVAPRRPTSRSTLPPGPLPPLPAETLFRLGRDLDGARARARGSSTPSARPAPTRRPTGCCVVNRARTRATLHVPPFRAGSPRSASATRSTTCSSSTTSRVAGRLVVHGCGASGGRRSRRLLRPLRRRQEHDRAAVAAPRSADARALRRPHRARARTRAASERTARRGTARGGSRAAGSAPLARALLPAPRHAHPRPRPLSAADAAARLFARTFPPPWDASVIGSDARRLRPRGGARCPPSTSASGPTRAPSTPCGGRSPPAEREHVAHQEQAARDHHASARPASGAARGPGPPTAWPPARAPRASVPARPRERPRRTRRGPGRRASAPRARASGNSAARHGRATSLSPSRRRPARTGPAREVTASARAPSGLCAPSSSTCGRPGSVCSRPGQRVRATARRHARPVARATPAAAASSSSAQRHAQVSDLVRAGQRPQAAVDARRRAHGEAAVRLRARTLRAPRRAGARPRARAASPTARRADGGQRAQHTVVRPRRSTPAFSRAIAGQRPAELAPRGRARR